MNAPYYIFAQRGQWMLHWSGPWDSRELFDAAVACARKAYPSRDFKMCGSSDLVVKGADIGGGGFVEFSSPSVRSGPNLSEIQEIPNA